jgi:diguanylate cyclase (GGDEF)-like protein
MELLPLPPTLHSRRRLAALRDTALLDTPAEEAFDRVVRLAAAALGAPTAWLSLVDEDREYVKASIGDGPSAGSSRPLAESVAAVVLAEGEPLVLDDVRAHGAFRDHPAVMKGGIGSAACIPVATPGGLILGALCATAPEPRRWTAATVRVLADLSAEILTQLELRTERQRRARAEETLRELDMIDELTGVFNQKGLLTLAKPQLKLARRVGATLLLIFVDVKALRVLNRDFGEPAGDRALRELAQLFRETCRESDLVARLGGDEFAILAMEGDEPGDEVLPARLLANLDDLNARRGDDLPLEVGLGIARHEPDHSSSVLELVIRASNDLAARKQRSSTQPG